MSTLRTGLVLGGGGEVGIAWEIGVLAALAEHTTLSLDDLTVVAGTSAGSVVGALIAVGRDPHDLYALEQQGGQSVSPIPVEADATAETGTDGSDGTAVVPPELLALLMATDGTIEERAAAVGRVSVDLPTAVDQQQLVDAFTGLLGTTEWPQLDFRASAVHASTGRTVLWSSADAADLATAVASSCAVPGFFPAVQIAGEYYIDAGRTPISDRLAAELDLDLVVFVGLDLPILSNSTETTALDALHDSGISSVAVTGGPDVASVAAELMDPRARPRAAEIGYADGVAAAAAVDSAVQAAQSRRPLQD